MHCEQLSLPLAFLSLLAALTASTASVAKVIAGRRCSTKLGLARDLVLGYCLTRLRPRTQGLSESFSLLTLKFCSGKIDFGKGVSFFLPELVRIFAGSLSFFKIRAFSHKRMTSLTNVYFSRRFSVSGPIMLKPYSVLTCVIALLGRLIQKLGRVYIKSCAAVCWHYFLRPTLLCVYITIYSYISVCVCHLVYLAGCGDAMVKCLPNVIINSCFNLKMFLWDILNRQRRNAVVNRCHTEFKSKKHSSN